MNKNYRLLSFRSFFIFFSFLSFFEGSPSSGFFSGGGERLKILYSRRGFFTFRFFHFFFILHFFTFLHFLHFQIFSLFYIFTIFRFFHFFTFLHFYNFSEVTLPVVYTGSVYFLFFKKMGGGPDSSKTPTTF